MQTKSDINFLGKQLKMHRVRKKLSQAILAKLLGMSQTRICFIERGSVNTIQLDTLCKLARALDVSPKVFFK